jgi:anti-anti-sigma regulatory factor
LEKIFQVSPRFGRGVRSGQHSEQLLVADKAGIIMSIRIDQSEKKCVITCEGEITQQQVQELRASFIKMLINVDEVAFDLQGSGHVGLALLQLLCSAHRSAARLNKRFVFAGARPDLLEKTAGTAGYLRQSGCSLDQDKTCLWTAQPNRSA